MNSFGKSIAVIIGINNYQDGISPLETAKQDAEAIASLLEERHGYEVLSLLNEQASHKNLNNLFRKELLNFLV